MNAFAKFATAAAAVLVVGIAGFALLPNAPGRGGTASVPPSLSPSPSPSVELSPSPSPAPSELAFFRSGPISPGRHTMVRSGKAFSVDMPGSGWFSNGAFRIYTVSGQNSFIFWTEAPTNVYARPCTREPLDPPAGDTPAELAVAVSSIPGTEPVDEPTDVTIGGHQATHVSIRIREDVGCAPEGFSLWYAGDPATGRWPDALGDTIHVWIIDVDGTNVWIDAEVGRNTGPELQAEMQQIVESIQFE
jgi:hypothetical protein